MNTTDAALKRSNRRVIEAGRSSRNLIALSVPEAIELGARTYEDVCRAMPNVALDRDWVEGLL